MARNNSQSGNNGTPVGASSAPEVPTEVAKQYGLVNDHAVNTKATAGVDLLPKTPAPIEDPETDAVVDELIKQEGDDLLAVQQPVPPKVAKDVKRPGIFGRLWRRRWLRKVVLIVLLGSIAAVAIVPSTRYALLNKAGVRSAASIIVVDETTKLPLKNVQVIIGGKTAQTNIKGIASVTGLPLGKSQVRISRLAFADYQRGITIGWGSNPLGTVGLRSVGLQYVIKLKDYLTGLPIAGAEVTSNQVNALSNEEGSANITFADTAITKLLLTITAQGYRPQTVEADLATTTPSAVVLVPDHKTVYINKSSGKYDVYQSDLDGQDKKVLLAGTGHETSTISLVVSPDNTRAVLVSTRDNKRDSAGNVLQGLTMITLATGASTTIDYAAQIQLVDWIGDKLIYRSTVAGVAPTDTQRNRLVAYAYAANARTQLATASQFIAVTSAQGYIYYAPAAADPDTALGLFRIKADSTGREQLSDKQIWSVIRSGSNMLHIQTPEAWISFDLMSKETQDAVMPPSLTSYYFARSPDGNQLAWTDVRAGTGTLLAMNSSGTEKVVATQKGIAQPVRWISDTILLYRVSSSAETADYLISTKGGTPRKVSDVSASYGYIQAN